ncbi:citryl-CoA lyase [Candidatus Woesearchaeota archaeon]|nr:citryl-CoA lyase [Candidatus Woesearchaeota archaeon]
MADKKWKTSIADSTQEGAIIRGYPLIDMIDKLTFTEAIFLLLKGELPSEKQRKMTDAILVTSIEHGIAPPSAQAARIIASGGNSINVAIAGGILTLGEHHGGAIEEAARIMQENAPRTVNENPKKIAAEIVRNILDQKKRLSGFGHKLYTTDPRTTKLFEVARKIGFFGPACELALEMEKQIEEQKGRKLCLNVDGAVAAIITEMGFDWRMAKAFFIIPRTCGLAAHSYEELTKEAPFRRLEKGEYEYIGEKRREL